MRVDRAAIGFSSNQFDSEGIEDKQGFMVDLLDLILPKHRDQIAIDDLLIVTIDDFTHPRFDFSIEVTDRQFGDINEASADIDQTT